MSLLTSPLGVRKRTLKKLPSFVPDDLSSLFALYDADRVSDQFVAEDTFATDGTLEGLTSDSGHIWNDPGTNQFSVSSGVVSAGPTGGTFAVVNAGISDGVIQADFRTSSGTAQMGLAFRSDNTDDNALAVVITSSTVRLFKRVTGSWTLLTSTDVTTTNTNTWYTLRVAFHGTHIKAWRDPTNVSVEDPHIDYELSSSDYDIHKTNTNVGLANAASQPYDARNFKVSTLDQVADHTIAYDSFTRTDSTTIGSTEVGGLTWVEHAGNSTITNNHLDPVGTDPEVTAVDTGVADVVVAGDVRMSNNSFQEAGLCFRLADSANYMFVRLDAQNNNLSMRKREAGAISGLVSTTTPISESTIYQVRVVLIQDRILLYVDSVLMFDYTMTSGDFTTFGSNTSHGFWSTNATDGAYFDNFRVRRLTRVPVWADVSRTGTDRVNANHLGWTTESEQAILLEDWDGTDINNILFDNSRIFAPMSVSQPMTTYVVANVTDAVSNTALVATSGIHHKVDAISAGQFPIRFYAGTTAQNSIDVDLGTDFVSIANWDGASTEVRTNGTVQSFGDLGPNGLGGVNPINLGGTATFAIIAVQDTVNTQVVDFEQWASEKYGITLA